MMRTSSSSSRISGSAAKYAGSTLDRDRPIRFRFDGRPLVGFAGDSLASALLANGVRTVGRSFKFHRPRGVYSCGVEEPNALVQLGSGARGLPSVRSTLIDLYEGMEAFSHSGWPSLRFDIARALDFAAPLWAAGFYNKTFMWPSWHTYEEFVRRMAGFGRAPTGPDPDRYDTRNLHCDVLVIGGGAAGLRAATAAAVAGSRVVLADQSTQLGGRCAWDGSTVDGMAGATWAHVASQRLTNFHSVRILRNTTAVGYYERDIVTLLESVPVSDICSTRADPAHETHHGAPRERYWVVRAKRVVLATGAIEQPLIFCNNDRPGILLAGAAHEYLRRYSVAVGRRVIVATNNDSAYAVARDLKEAGVNVLAVADTRHEVPQSLAQELRALSIPLLTGSIPVDTSGFSTLSGVSVGRLSRDYQRVESVQRYACDALAISGGWCPSLHLYSQAGGKLVYRDDIGAFGPLASHPVVTLAGSVADGSQNEGRYIGSDAGRWQSEVSPTGSAAGWFQNEATLTAAGQSLHQTSSRSAAPVSIGRSALTQPAGALGIRVSPVGSTQRQWVDLRHDVTVADLELALRENYSSIEHVKRYTTVGMSVDQGKTSNVSALEIIASLRRMKPSELGHTTMRPPFTPVTLGAIAGRSLGERFAPSRRTPMHDWHVAHGAVLEDFGEWKRPAVYLRPGESRLAGIMREARAVRSGAGLFDGSPLGKIEVQGPDALEFLDHFYINNLKTLKPGRVRYGLMLRESGVILDDGTVAMLAPDRLVITTTSGNAGRVAAWLEEWHQCEWPQLQVAITLVTDQWAVLSLTGPKARDILSKLDTDIDVSGAAFPHLALREGQILGHPARIYRVSYTGELTYEINVPAGAGQHLWDVLLAAGRPADLQPFGIEALLLMRLEKGFLHVGTDTDGTTVPDDVGWGKVATTKTADFIGKRSLSLPEHVRPDRLQLVGLVSDADIVVGSHLRAADSKEVTDGWVTSAGRSVLTGEPIALAQLRGGRQLVGAQVSVHDAGKVTRAKVVSPSFFDPAGEHINA